MAAFNEQSGSTLVMNKHKGFGYGYRFVFAFAYSGGQEIFEHRVLFARQVLEFKLLKIQRAFYHSVTGLIL